MSTLHRELDAKATHRRLSEYLTQHRETIQALHILPTERLLPDFAELAQWSASELGQLGERLPLATLRRYAQALDDALQLRIPVSTSPLPLPAVYARLQALVASLPLDTIEFGMTVFEGIEQALVIASRDAPGAWGLTDPFTGLRMGTLGADGAFRFDAPRPEDIEHQAASMRLLRTLVGMELLEKDLQSSQPQHDA